MPNSIAKFAVICFLCWSVGSSLGSTPYFLSYFNEASGGSSGGHKHLLNSNVDWGQGLLALDNAIDANPEWGPVAILYSGSITPESLGSRVRQLPDWKTLSRLEDFTHLAISANYLMGDLELMPRKTETGKSTLFELCRAAEPVETLDGSIFVYETADLLGELPETPGNDPAPMTPKMQECLEALPTLADSDGVKSISGLLHILILHKFGNTGLTEFGYPATGQEALRILTDERLCKTYLDESLFIKTRNGIRYRLVGTTGGDGGNDGESHRDQCLSVFAMLDLPPNTPLVLEEGEATIADLISESVANFTFEQGEMNWTAMSFAHYLAPARQWTDRFGKTTTFSDLANHLMDTGYVGQSCGGLHVLQAVAELEKADDRAGILDRTTRIRCRKFVQDALDQIIAGQKADGSWRFEWYESVPASDHRDDQSTEESTETKVIVTGHMLELLHQLRNRVPPKTIARSTHWLVDTMRNSMPRKKISVCPLTHAIHGVRMSALQHNSSLELVELFANGF